MKHMDLADYIRKNYTIVVSKDSDRFTKFLGKCTAYCLDDKIVSSIEEVTTDGYIVINKECKLLVEDIIFNLVKIQTEKEAGIVYTPGKKVIAYNKKFKDKELVFEGELYDDIRQINEDWLRGGFIKNSISSTLGGYSMVHHIYNTERYMTGKIKKYTYTDFQQFVLLPSGLKFLWLLKKFNYTPDKPIVFYDVSSYPLAFVQEMISHWNPLEETLHDWALDNPVTKGIMISSGQTREGVRPGMGPSSWNDCWERELKEFGSVEEIANTLNLLKKGNANGLVSFINLNIAFDYVGQTILFGSLDKTSTVLWLSNIFDSSPISSYTASNPLFIYKQDARKLVTQRLYNTLRQKLPHDTLVLGSVPIDNDWNGYDYKD